MIQRIQTLFLLGVALLLGTTLMVPSWKGSNEVSSVSINALSITMNETQTTSLVVGSLCIAVIAISLIAIFLYKNRALQIKLCGLNTLLIAGVIVASIYTIFANKPTDLTSESYQLGCFLPFIAIIINAFAIKFIKKDENLIRSMNRIR